VNISGVRTGIIDLSSNNWAYKVLSPIVFGFLGQIYILEFNMKLHDELDTIDPSFFTEYDSFFPLLIYPEIDMKVCSFLFKIYRLDWKGNIIICSSLIRQITNGGYHNPSHQKTNL
jgi:hypothetical protein